MAPPTTSSVATLSVDTTPRRYHPGDRVLCTRGGASHECEVVERREADKGGEYYVHFLNLDRRLDTWVSAEVLSTFAPDDPSSPALAKLHKKNEKRVTRRDKRKFHNTENIPLEGLGDTHAALEKEHEERTKVKNIYSIQIGKYLVDTWYWSPYPGEYRNQEKLFICEYCLKYMRKAATLEAHKKTCVLRHPPGDEIYRDRGISVFEVDGCQQKLYCQCLCLLAKLFIDHKTLYYDVELFRFYILTESDKNGHRVVGYFSKEKQSAEDLNVACILTFPQYQRKGYGKFLITLSYELSKIEGKAGSPEKPLSDLGKVSYRSYWTRTLLELLASSNKNVAVTDVSQITAIKIEDVISTLQLLGLVRYVKGQHVICVTPKILEQHQAKLSRPPRLALDPARLEWTPPVLPPRQKK